MKQQVQLDQQQRERAWRIARLASEQLADWIGDGSAIGEPHDEEAIAFAIQGAARILDAAEKHVHDEALPGWEP